jgi:Flp pilus assembly pilin Flp
MTRLVRFLRSESGTTTVEYAVLLAVLLAAVVAAVASFRPAAEAQFESTGNSVGTYGVAADE